MVSAILRRFFVERAAFPATTPAWAICLNVRYTITFRQRAPIIRYGHGLVAQPRARTLAHRSEFVIRTASKMRALPFQNLCT
jgi:hypothetical protein